MLRLIIAFSTERTNVAPTSADALEPPSNYKNPDVIAKWRAERAAEISDVALMQPYTARLKEIAAVAFDHSGVAQAGRWAQMSPTDSTAGVQFRCWLQKNYPADCLWTVGQPPTAVFVGFDPKLFVHMLSVDCSNAATPENDTRLPLSFIYPGGRNTFDLEDLSLVKRKGAGDYPFIDWNVVASSRKLGTMVSNWKGPHMDVDYDLTLSKLLADRLGLSSIR